MSKKLPPYTYLGCPHANHSPWCYALCRPVKGVGTCGRPAPFLQKGRTQRAIEAHQRKQKEQELVNTDKEPPKD